jgi:formylglycine-generating enzyme required for sulfatase activity
MGDWTGEQKDAVPVHTVRVQTFFLSKHEVMVSEFDAFVDATGYETSIEKLGSAPDWDGEKFVRRPGACWKRLTLEQEPNHPVTLISWIDAVHYCNWRSRSEGLTPCFNIVGDTVTCDFSAGGYRLPTEAEWEYAATNGGKKVRYPWGNAPPEKCVKKPANLKDEKARAVFGNSSKTWRESDFWDGYTDDYAFTSPVGTFAPNTLGLYDMIGNVYEWCWDVYEEHYPSNDVLDDQRGPVKGSMRCARGNGWNCPPQVVNCQHRGAGKQDESWHNMGFRLAASSNFGRGFQ